MSVTATYPQCPFMFDFGLQCQGIASHPGRHWCYMPSGAYREYQSVPWFNRQWSPDQPGWVSPVNKIRAHYEYGYRDLLRRKTIASLAAEIRLSELDDVS